MGYRGKRRRDRFLLGGAALLIGGAGAIGALAGDTERIAAYWLHADLSADGPTTIVEVIDYDFGSSARRGILRNIPDLDPGAAITASSATAPDDLLVTPGAGEAVLRIGDPAVTIRNRHRYRIEYPLQSLVAGAVGSGAVSPGAVVVWDAVGTGFDVPIGNAVIHLTAPFELGDLRCDRGRTSSVGGCTLEQVAPGHVQAEVDGLDAGEGVTVSAVAGAPLAADVPHPVEPAGAAPDPGTGWLPPGLAGLAGALATAGIVSSRIRRAGREQVWPGGPADVAFGPPADSIAGLRIVDHADLEAMATIEFESPRGLSAAAGGIIHDEGVRDRHQVAWLIEAAIRDEIRLVDDGDGDHIAIERGPAVAHPAVGPTLDLLFAGRDRVELGTYDPAFAAGWKRLAVELGEWERSSGLWDPAGRARRRRARLLGVLGAVVGLAMVVLGGVAANRSGAAWIVVVVAGGLLAGAAVAALVRSWELLVRTPEGSGRWLQTESFRRFIRDSEARHAEAAAQRGLLRHYTAWAVALGELDHWRRAVDAAAEIPGSAAAGAGADLRLAAMTAGLSSAVSSSSTAPSSSGGGGGGGVGGGGGGGGGGSW